MAAIFQQHHVFNHKMRTHFYMGIILLVAFVGIVKFVSIMNDRHAIDTLDISNQTQPLPSVEIADDDTMCIGDELWQYHKEGNKLVFEKYTEPKSCK